MSDDKPGAGPDRPSLAVDLARTLRFYSRLPVPRLPGETDLHAAPDFARLTPVVPVAGAILGAIGALVLYALAATGLPPLVVALFTIAAMVRLTGAFHEDGLADTADGLGGGRDIAAKLEIMKDSRIGTYGGAALILALALRAALLAGLIALSPALAALSFVAASALSRTVALSLAVVLAPARADGAAFAAGRPPAGAFAVACLIAVLIVAGTLGSFGLLPVVAGIAAAALAAAWMLRLSARSIGGQTGDLAGATQMVAEIAFLTAVLMVRPEST
jgi:adenosylcobinamide-GDP ribazoletransferase